MMKRLLLYLFSVMALVGCVSEKDASDVILLVTPSSFRTMSGETVYYTVNAWSNNGSLREISMSTFSPEFGEVQVSAESISSESFNGKLFYEAPSIEQDSLSLEIRFIARDDVGKIQTQTYPLKVISDEHLLKELTSVSLYSPDSGKPAGFSFSAMSSVSVPASPEGTVDFYLYKPEGVSPDLMCCEFRSMTGMLFSKVTGLDYPALTYRMLKDVYASSIKDVSVPSFGIDDVIIVGCGEDPVAAVKIMAVYDDQGYLDDRCVVNIKTAP